MDWEEVQRSNTYFTVYKKELRIGECQEANTYAIKKVNGEP